MSLQIEPIPRLAGEITLPGDKSISHRAVMLGALARGETRVRGLLDCDDCRHTIAAFRAMGIAVTQNAGETVIQGKGLRGLTSPAGPIDVGESGTSMRILAGILAGQDFTARLVGAPGLMRRPMKRVVEPLAAMGVAITAAPGDLPPLVVRGGPVTARSLATAVPSAQVKSAVLFAGLYADGVTAVEERYQSRDHTERMMGYFGAAVKIDGRTVSVAGGRELAGRSFAVPGDISGAAFFMAAATLIPRSRITIRRVSINPTRAGIIEVLRRMGASIQIVRRSDDFEPFADIEIASAETRGIVIDEAIVPNIIDELPAIFVVAALSRGKTVINGAGELKVKETDRIASMRANIVAMGGKMDVTDERITIEGVDRLRPAPLKTFGDHRTCMAMAVAALTAPGPSTIDDSACVTKSFPGFFDTLRGIVAK